MNVKIHRSARILIYPSVAARRLTGTVELNMCEEAVNKHRGIDRDSYFITVDFLRVEGFSNLEDASNLVDVFGRRRQLSLHELLSVNNNDPHIRFMWPIFAGDFVLESIPLDYDEDTDTAEKKWVLRASSTHRGIVIDKDSIFATTALSKVDLGTFTEKALELLAAPLDSGPQVIT